MTNPRPAHSPTPKPSADILRMLRRNAGLDLLVGDATGARQYADAVVLIESLEATHADAVALARMVTAWDQDECDMEDDRSLDMLHEIVIAARSLLAKSEGRE